MNIYGIVIGLLQDETCHFWASALMNDDREVKIPISREQFHSIKTNSKVTIEIE